MRRLLFCLTSAVLVGCASPDAEPPADADADAAAMAAPAGVALTDFAGGWQMKIMNEAGDSLGSFVLFVSPDGATWSIGFPNRDPITAHTVEAVGDSVMMMAGPYESPLRTGVQVEVHSVMGLQDDRLMGRVTATYASGPDSVVALRVAGDRMP